MNKRMILDYFVKEFIDNETSFNYCKTNDFESLNFFQPEKVVEVSINGIIIFNDTYLYLYKDRIELGTARIKYEDIKEIRIIWN